MRIMPGRNVEVFCCVSELGDKIRHYLIEDRQGVVFFEYSLLFAFKFCIPLRVGVDELVVFFAKSRSIINRFTASNVFWVNVLTTPND